MAIGWFIVPYIEEPVRLTDAPIPSRELLLASQDLPTSATWQEIEILGNRAIVKVRASPAVLTAIAALPNVKRLPRARLDDTVGDLPALLRRQIRDELRDQGYTAKEIRRYFGDDFADSVTLRDVLKFMASRWRKPQRAGDGSLAFGPVVRRPRRYADMIDRADRRVSE